MEMVQEVYAPSAKTETLHFKRVAAATTH
jgi:hypothetical protein